MLWRTDYPNANGGELYCVEHAITKATEVGCTTGFVNDYGQQTGTFIAGGSNEITAGYKTPRIGQCIPAIPTEENNAFYDLPHVPNEGLMWWQRLPLQRPDHP